MDSSKNEMQVSNAYDSTRVLLQEDCINLQYEHKNDRFSELQMVESKAEKRDAKRSHMFLHRMF